MGKDFHFHIQNCFPVSYNGNTNSKSIDREHKHKQKHKQHNNSSFLNAKVVVWMSELNYRLLYILCVCIRFDWKNIKFFIHNNSFPSTYYGCIHFHCVLGCKKVHDYMEVHSLKYFHLFILLYFFHNSKFWESFFLFVAVFHLYSCIGSTAYRFFFNWAFFYIMYIVITVYIFLFEENLKRKKRNGR